MQVFILGLGGYLSVYFQFEGHLSIYPYIYSPPSQRTTVITPYKFDILSLATYISSHIILSYRNDPPTTVRNTPPPGV